MRGTVFYDGHRMEALENSRSYSIHRQKLDRIRNENRFLNMRSVTKGHLGQLNNNSTSKNSSSPQQSYTGGSNTQNIANKGYHNDQLLQRSISNKHQQLQKAIIQSQIPELCTKKKLGSSRDQMSRNIMGKQAELSKTFHSGEQLKKNMLRIRQENKVIFGKLLKKDSVVDSAKILGQKWENTLQLRKKLSKTFRSPIKSSCFEGNNSMRIETANFNNYHLPLIRNTRNDSQINNSRKNANTMEQKFDSNDQRTQRNKISFINQKKQFHAKDLNSQNNENLIIKDKFDQSIDSSLATNEFDEYQL
ncbi:UNKNOWN [Stylonychia lemnae]|uniref:Uncharacterized protein n=1 Tax=Stylonychia lemnae TaxID=5949 RepID=A0A078A4D5_STYLE|nr:UNKNOWN [Stylonychia lemnae]|eukprot:CDW75629.1 UNKNOWN [Stylonychia lemnae]